MLIVIAASTFLVTGCGSNDNEDKQALKGDQIGQALLAGEYDRIYKQLSEEFHQQVTKEQLREASEGFIGGMKAWKPNSKFILNGGQYFTWTDEEGKRGLVATMDDSDRITGMRLMPLEAFKQTDNVKTKVAYDLPFHGEWFVFWGGQDVLSNYHYEVEMQRYAYDLVQVKDGYSYQGDEKSNESYYAFGQPIVAPQDGKVVKVVNDVADNEPVGVMNDKQPEGNVVVIDHGNEEYSFLAHLQKGSVKVKVGDQVSKGDLLGLCGNSGNSSEPHLHVQVSDHSDLFTAKSIRVQWQDDLDPRQGDIVKGSDG